MTRQREIQNIASAARRFIEPVWNHWHQSRGRPVPHPASRFTCGRTSLFLRDVLRHEGHPAEWTSGTPYAGVSGAPDTPCGFYSGTRWEGHAWVCSGETIIDITADQFGGDRIFITSVFDDRYVSSRDLANPDAIKARREAVAALWPDRLGFRSKSDLLHKS